MGEKDAAEKTLESYNDVFADIVNGLLFNGKQVVKENELKAESENSIYKTRRMENCMSRKGMLQNTGRMVKYGLLCTV